MPTFSRQTRGPMWDASTRDVEDRASFQRRLDAEDHAEDRGGTRLQSRNLLGRKKFGIEIVLSVGNGEHIRWKSWYRTAHARKAGLDHFNRRKNISPETMGWPHRYSAAPI